MSLSNSDITALFENIAETHSAIQHNNAGAMRYWSFDPDELIANERSQFNYDKLLLGMSISKQSAVTWNYKDAGTAQHKMKFINVAIIGKFNKGDYSAEDTTCTNCEAVADDIASWLWITANGQNECQWPVVRLMDVTNIACKRVKDIGVVECAGCVMSIPLRDYNTYSDANPLNSMTP